MSHPPYHSDTDQVLATAQEVAESTSGETVLAFIEIPRGSRNKYEYDEERGVFLLDRVLYSSVHYPTDYGFIPDTLADDGDHLDILVLVHEPTFPGCLIEARPLGGLNMADEKGNDFKVLAVPVGDPRFNEYQTLEDVHEYRLKEIETFFATYKLLEEKETEVLGWHGLAEAHQVIEQCRVKYREAQAASDTAHIGAV
jgi:inorganic pyrophosphatase